MGVMVEAQKKRVGLKKMLLIKLDLALVTVYGYNMSKNEKLLDKAKSNPNGLRFKEFETLLKQSGWYLDRQKGSHKIWVSGAGLRLPIQTTSGNAKGYQVKQFLAQLGSILQETEGESDEG